jgi:hypothetical protein
LAQYYCLDESGDPAVSDSASSSSHFALAMVQLPERMPIAQLAAVRKAFHLSPIFEFKYHTTTPEQKRGFFDTIQPFSFRVRVAVIDKSALTKRFALMSGQDFAIEFIIGLTLRAPELDIANDVLIVDGATLIFLRALRVRLSEECHKTGRVRPFRKIISGDSSRDDGLQLADMIVGAARHHGMGAESRYYRTFANKIVDWWEVPAEGQ